MIFQAIVTKYIGPTDRLGSRVKATASAGTLTLSWDCALNTDDNHANAAKALAEKFKWAGHWYCGGMPAGNGNVFVSTGGGDAQPAFITRGEG